MPRALNFRLGDPITISHAEKGRTLAMAGTTITATTIAISTTTTPGADDPRCRRRCRRRRCAVAGVVLLLMAATIMMVLTPMITMPLMIMMGREPASQGRL
jgi:hypothetical protein